MLSVHDCVAHIPLVAAICTEIDVARRRIVADPPEGLLAVNERGAP